MDHGSEGSMGDIIRKTRNGVFIGWYIRFVDADGRRKQRASHQSSKADARRYLVEIEARVARGKIGIPEPGATAEPLTVAELAERFFSEFTSPKIKDLARYRTKARYSLKPVVQALGKLQADQLTRAHVERLRDSMLRRLRPNTVRSALRPLSTILSWAVRQKLLSAHPLRGLEMPRHEQAIEFLAHDEVRRLLDEAERLARGGTERHWSLFIGIALGLYCGMRRGEIFGLRWTDINLDGRRLTVARNYERTPKSGKPRHLPIASELLPLLSEWRARCPQTPERLVCPVSWKGRWQMAKKAPIGLIQLMEAAKVSWPSAPWHALRHTFASQFIMAGGNILTLQRLLGHADVQTTQVYAHLAPDFMAGEVERLRFR